MMMGMAILAEAGLSFLGIGIEPPGAAWGAMVSDGYRYLLTNPILSFAPGVAIMLVVFAFNMVGDGLRDALDPRLKGYVIIKTWSDIEDCFIKLFSSYSEDMVLNPNNIDNDNPALNIDFSDNPYYLSED